MFKSVIVIAFVGLLGCATGPAPEPEVKIVPGPEVLVTANENLNAALWTQTSAEWKALTLQTYVQADMALDAMLKNKKWTAATEQTENFAKKPAAIIVDVDETVLDNSAYQARLVHENGSFTEDSWNAWCKEGKASAVPGSVEFLQKAASKGVTVFYVTNRAAEVEDVTRQNLAAMGFPIAEGTDVVLTKGEKPEWTSDKTTRRQTVAETHRVVMMFGDNLGDFTTSGKGSIDERAAVVSENAAKWGRGWYMLPNPMYGYWEAATFGYAYDLDPKAKQAAKAAKLVPLN
ncbi:MAG: 5'-nucleotidase, lipoprotein e(P4) family [bacterium]